MLGGPSGHDHMRHRETIASESIFIALLYLGGSYAGVGVTAAMPDRAAMAAATPWRTFLVHTAHQPHLGSVP